MKALLSTANRPLSTPFITYFFLLFCFGSAPLFGQSFTAEALGFNVFVEQDFTFGGGDVEGSVAVGNALTVQGNQGQFSVHSAGSYMPAGFSTPISLVVGHDVALNGGGVRLLNQGKIMIESGTNTDALSLENGHAANTRIVSSGNSYSSTPNISLDHTQTENIYQGCTIDFATAFAMFQSRSAAVGNLATNVSITNANGNPLDPNALSHNSQVYIQSLGAGTNILNLTGGNANKISSLTFQDKPSANKFLVINIDHPGTFHWNNFGFAGIGSVEAQYILLNFTNSTKVHINKSPSVYATIFAPYAAVRKNKSNNIDGQVIAQSFTMTCGGEVHDINYLGDDPSGSFPVEWGDFEVEAIHGVSQLHWSTLSESNTSHFVIERSFDGQVYAPVGRVEAVGESQQIQAYQFTDREQPLQQGTLYYRLAQIDLDGSMSYSVVRSVRVEPSFHLQANCYPNPTSNWVNLSWESSEAVGLQVLGLQGQILLEQRFPATQRTAQVDLSHLPSGRYILQFTALHQVEHVSVYRN